MQAVPLAQGCLSELGTAKGGCSQQASDAGNAGGNPGLDHYRLHVVLVHRQQISRRLEAEGAKEYREGGQPPPMVRGLISSEPVGNCEMQERPGDKHRATPVVEAEQEPTPTPAVSKRLHARVRSVQSWVVLAAEQESDEKLRRNQEQQAGR